MADLLTEIGIGKAIGRQATGVGVAAEVEIGLGAEAEIDIRGESDHHIMEGLQAERSSWRDLCLTW